MSDKKAILLIDDDKALLEIGREILEQHGYKIFTAESGEKALEVSRAEEGRIKLAILDLNLPGMSGEECLEQLKKFNTSLKVIISSGYSDDNRIAKLLGCGASAYVQKPYRVKNMLETAETLLKNC